MRFGIRELIFLMVLLAVPVASFWYVFKPRNEEIRKAKSEIELKQAKLDKLADVTNRIEDIGLAIEKGREAIELIEAKLPSQQDVEVILEQIWQTAARHRLTIKSVKSEKSVPAALHMEQPLRVVMEGEFDGFYQFLLELENLPRITRMPQMKLQKLGAGGANKDLPTGIMKAEFTLSIYFEPQSMASGKP
jgi:type IV pilus assembly protein PilO